MNVCLCTHAILTRTIKLIHSTLTYRFTNKRLISLLQITSPNNFFKIYLRKRFFKQRMKKKIFKAPCRRLIYIHPIQNSKLMILFLWLRCQWNLNISISLPLFYGARVSLLSSFTFLIYYKTRMRKKMFVECKQKFLYIQKDKMNETSGP